MVGDSVGRGVVRGRGWLRVRCRVECCGYSNGAVDFHGGGKGRRASRVAARREDKGQAVAKGSVRLRSRRETGGGWGTGERMNR